MRKIRLTESQMRVINILRENKSYTEVFENFININEGIVDDIWVKLSEMTVSGLINDDVIISDWLEKLDSIESGTHDIYSHKEGVLSDISKTKGDDVMMKVDVYIDNMFTTLNKKVRVLQSLLVKLSSVLGDDEVVDVFGGVRSNT